MKDIINKEPTINDLFELGFKSVDGALVKDDFYGEVQYWDGRFFHSDGKKFLSEIKSIDDLNNLLIENTKS